MPDRRLLAFAVSEQVYRRLTLLAVVLVVLLIGTGGWVRLSESGLGCPTWPKCYAQQLVAHDSYHALVEFANRCMITAVGVVVVLAFLGAIRRGRRRDLVWLSLGLLVGYIGEAALGGITVLLKLAPELVAGHLVLAMLLLADAVVLHWRAGDGGAHREARRLDIGVPRVGSDARLLGWLMLALIGLVMILGTLATGSGPRAGNPGTPRFDLRFSSMVELHAVVGMLLFGLVVACSFLLRATGAPRRVRNLHVMVIATMALQGAIGYLQYFTDLQTGLVEAHIIGAALLLIILLRFNLELGAQLSTGNAQGSAVASRRHRAAFQSLPR